MMSQVLQPYVKSLPASPGQSHLLFGYRLPFLPDWLADHTLLGRADQEKLDEVLSRWTQFVLGLRKWEGSAFALRFHARPQAGRVDVALLVRLRVDAGKSHHLAQIITADLSGQLTAMGLPHTPCSEGDLNSHLFPFAAPSFLVDVRQHEEVTPFMVFPGEAYLIHPFWRPAGAWLRPFEMLLRQPAEVTVSLYLEPTTLTVQEKDALVRAAQIARTLTEQTIKTYSDNTLAARRDPQAELVGRIYQALTTQLTEPYLSLVQCVSPDASAAWTMARTFGAAITAGKTEIDDDEQRLPSGFDVIAPTTPEQMGAARRCFAQLELIPWGNGLASDDKKRLVYLTGARGAAAVFRLPVSVRGGVPGIAVKQTAPDFEPGPRPAAAAADELHLGDFQRGGAVTAQLKHLVRHALVVGFTGAGKTNTVLYLLDQLWRRHRIPFLVIEAAKKEYRGFIGREGFADVLVFTLGDETTAPFRLNPFELLPGVRLEAHLGGLQACFDAALPQFGILPSIVAESLEEIYKDKKWKLTDRGGEHPNRLFPTMRDMFNKVIQIAESRGYAGETYHNIRAAAAGRIGNLLRGSRGRMFDCQRGIPMDLLLNRPVVLELNDLNQQDKALTMMFLLTFLREYRELHKGKTLQHVAVVEEAHNVLENVKSVGASEVAADTRAKAVEAFAGMLAEVRAYGEGILISDQSPDKLSPDAVRNTNLQIAHQLRHKVDREAIAAAMIMTDAQQEFLGKLGVGQAAVFMTGYDRATFMQVPNFKDDATFADHEDKVVKQAMQPFNDQYKGTYLPFDGCRFCASPCQYREAIEPYTLDKEATETLKLAIKRFDERPAPQHWPDNWRGVALSCKSVADRTPGASTVDNAWCYLAHEIDFPFTEHMRRSFERAFGETGNS